MSSGGDQGKFLSGGASARALSLESQSGEASAWASPRESKGGGDRS